MMDTETTLQALRRRWWIVVGLTVLGILVGVAPEPASSEDAITRWTASHTLLVSSPGSSATSSVDPVTMNQLQLFTTTGEVPRRAAEAIGFSGVPAALAGQISVQVEQQSGALRITTTQDTAEQAVRVADAFADELVSYLAERQDALREERIAATLERLEDAEAEVERLQRLVRANPEDRILTAQLDAFTRQYSVVFEQYNALQVDQGQVQLTTIERAQAVAITERGLAAPSSRGSRGVLGGLLGAGVGVAAALLVARLDRRIRTRAQAEAVLGLRSEVGIPHSPKGTPKELAVVPGRHDTLSDAYRTLRSVVNFVEGGEAKAAGRAPVILVVSPGPGDGKTSVAANLAAALVETGQRTVAVNTDFRRPSLSERILGAKPEPLGFTVEDLSSLPIKFMIMRTALDDLVLVDLAGTGGSPGDLARLTAKVLPQLSSLSDAVVVDTSPVGATAEVLELLPLADVIVVVIRLNHTTVDAASRTIGVLRALTKAHLLLTVVGETQERTAYYYEYSGRKEPAKKKRRVLARR